MGLRADDRDLADPAVRAALRLARRTRRERRWRRLAATLAWTLALAAPFLPGGDHGATYGAIVLALLLIAIATVVGPRDRSSAEARHRELEAIWRELRPGAPRDVPWERCAAWAEQSGDDVDLVLIRCMPTPARVAGAPSPFTRRWVRRIGAQDVAAAAEAMEELRAEAADKELAARQRHDRNRERERRREHEQALHEIDAVAAAELRAREEQLELEIAAGRAQEAAEAAAERDAQAAAVARALRRP